MGYNFIVSLSAFLVIGFYLFTPTYAKKCAPYRGYEVRITNTLPNSEVVVHCKSADDDLGFPHLRYNEEFSWDFCENFLGTTLFFCTFSAQPKSQQFDVFNPKLMDQCERKAFKASHCNWNVTADGFYFYNFKNNAWEKRYDWR